MKKNLLKTLILKLSKLLFIIFVVYFLISQKYSQILIENGFYIEKIGEIDKHLNDYLGIYKKILNIYLLGSCFIIFLENPRKKRIFEIRLFFFVIMTILFGYSYLIVKILNNKPALLDGEITNYILNLGLLELNLGYIEVYTFLKLYQYIDIKLLIFLIIFILLFTIFIIFGKVIRNIFTFLINFKRIVSSENNGNNKKNKLFNIRENSDV